ncbi:hypothetical protein DTW90_36810 [Neorhizobium sp. P12A]|uniref:hypothetical protein n=1 Tax=Neorhizobium sp. P12A TaxID=2268027 RepID=UPI0011EC7FE0|nr:hypothetical protein [Neorhizobium sp. P12A]KAA0682507.1 hypothetical protein DTW90_36810 [Neorhizobium sp. P12A]
MSLQSGGHSAQAATSPKPGKVRAWIKEILYIIVLVLTVFGVAYSSIVKQPIILYWEILAPIIGAVCVSVGWRDTDGKVARLRLIVTQTLHWLAFLIVMNLIMLPVVQRILNASATGLAIITLLALGTFTAGVHVVSWQVCLLGVAMALAIPAIAWIENSALIVVLMMALALGIAALSWWFWQRNHRIDADLED